MPARLALLVLLLVPTLATAAKPDKAGCKDPALFTRMPDFYIRGCKELQFDARKFRVGEKGKSKEESIEGHVRNITYATETKPPPSILQWLRNHQAAARQIGGE
ncbi:MAG: hypothetical protein ACYC8T_36540, partial [Myxococcaceae bacterium]